MCLSLWGTLWLEAAVMFMERLHNGTATQQLHDSILCPVPGSVNGWGMDSLDMPNSFHLLFKSASVTSQTLGIWLYEETEFLICSLRSGLSVENESSVCEKPANQASNGSQMRLPCSFAAVSPIAALCCQRGKLSFISVTTKKQKNAEAGVKTC